MNFKAFHWPFNPSGLGTTGPIMIYHDISHTSISYTRRNRPYIYVLYIEMIIKHWMTIVAGIMKSNDIHEPKRRKSMNRRLRGYSSTKYEVETDHCWSLSQPAVLLHAGPCQHGVLILAGSSSSLPGYQVLRPEL